MKKIRYHSRFTEPFITCLLLFLASEKVAAQQPGGYTPGSLLDTVIDYLGNKYSLGQIAVNDTIRGHAYHYPPLSSTEVSTCSSGYFEMYIDSGSGLDGSSAINVARRNVICRVLYDISQFIHSPCDSTGQKINIWVRNADSVGGIPAGLLGVAASFYNVPAMTTVRGIQDNTVWITLNSGTDAYTNVASPLMTEGGTYSSGASFFHGWMAFRFDTAHLWNTNLGSPPGTDTFDLYTVALHEMLHALGFVSLINYDGTSKLGTDFPYYTRYDQHLYSGATPLITTSDSCNLYQWGFNSAISPPESVLSPAGSIACPSGFTTSGIDDTICAAAINYIDAMMTRKVYTAGCFEPASSLSHFNDLCTGSVPGGFVPAPPLSDHQYYLMSNVVPPGAYSSTTNPGAMKRYPKTEERQVLCDIGYVVDTTFGNSVNLNYNNYHTTICGYQVAGIDDGITDTGTYEFFTTAGVAVTINGGTAGSLLSNDYHANKFKCLEVIEGAGPLSATTGTASTTVTFTPSAGYYGVELLRYIPVDTTTGTEGNITYVYVYVGDTGCTPSACNLVSNGTFESANVALVPYDDGAINCWSTLSGSPDLWSDYSYGYPGYLVLPSTVCDTPSDVHYPGSTPLLSNHRCVALEGTADAIAGDNFESIESALTSSLVTGQTYDVSCWAKLANTSSYSKLPTTLELAVAYSAGGIPYASGTYTTLPPVFTPLCTFMVGEAPAHYPTASAGWTYYHATVAYAGPTANLVAVANAIYLNPITPPYPSFYFNYMFVDDVSIRLATSLAHFNLPNPIYICDNSFDLDTMVSTPGGTFSWETISGGTVDTTTNHIFNPLLAYEASDSIGDGGAVTVCYTYTDGAGCLQTVCSTTYIITPPQIHGDTLICPGDTTTLTDSAAGGTWSSGNTHIATINTSGMVTGVSHGVDTIYYSLTSGCVISDVVTVNIAPTAITGATVVCVNSTISLADSIPYGTWSSSNTSVATVDSLSGIVLGLAAGTCTITYVNACGYSLDSLTVNPIPMPIHGADSVCVGSSITLIDVTHGGTWTISPSTVATITTSGGVVTGLAGGIADVRYTIHSSGCYVGDTIIVHTLPPVIYSPSAEACVGDPITLIDSADIVGVWSSSNTSVATIDPGGDFYGVGIGTVTITYTGTFGCYVTYELTVNSSPAPITGVDSVCVGGSTAFTDATRGGTWRSGNLSIATITLRGGIATGLSSGVDTIYYTSATGCYATAYLTVDAAPSIITGPGSVCVGSTITLTDSVVDGTWSSGNTSLATVDPIAGIVTGISPGLVVITYSNECGSQSIQIVINPIPLPISGGDTLCVGSGLKLTDATPDGTWSSSVTTVATFTSPGILYGASVGTSVISYSLSTGCFVTDTVVVLMPPTVDTIVGYDSICVGGTLTYSDDSSGGLWSSSNTSTASIDPLTGIITGISSGTATISYSVMNYCGTVTVTRTVYIIGLYPLPVISGFPGVCSGTNDTLSDTVIGGTWRTSDPTIATVGVTSGIVTGLSSGTVTITYTVMEYCGPSFVTKTVVVNMLPYITTNTIVACMALSGLKGGGGYVLPDSTCILVCDSTIIRYYGMGDAGSVFTWVVVGGTVLANYGDSIDVEWPTAGVTGSITLFDTVSHCTGEYRACIQVIQRPHADFSASAVNICLGTNVIFTDLSTADISSPIVSWNWNFGDGGFSSVENPNHTFSSAGTDTVTLVVRNACNCTDTFKLIINISSLAGQIIQCSSVMCDSEITWYTTSGGCGTYNWSVIGGTIIAGLGTDSIQVVWNNASPGGFGYVSLAEPCALCPDTTTIRVPVILQHPQITGLDTICAGQQYAYSFPLWPATQYMWGVLDNPGVIVGPNNDYQVVVEFSTQGTDTIHGWYQNRIKLCGANVDKVITVVPALSIVGSTSICQYGTNSYTLSDTSLAGIWTLSNITSGAVVDTVTGSIFTLFSEKFDTPGIYMLTVTGAFCANPLTITVTAIPPPIDSVTGTDTVCLNRVYAYTAYSDTPGTIFSWNAIGGTVTPASGSAHANVIWTASGTKQLIVSRVNTAPPYCMTSITKNIIQEVINPHVTGDTTPCSNSYRIYNGNYTRGEVYNWAVYPDSLGSVTGGVNGPVDTILWNNVSAVTAASIVLTLHKCDSVFFDTLHVNVQPSPLPTINGSPSPACPSDTVTFRASSGDSLYVWNFGDGTRLDTTIADSIKHPFPVNTTTGNVFYTIEVTVIPSAGLGCPPVGTNVMTIAILPGPVANASTATYVICPHDEAILIGTVTDNLSGLTYQWYNSSGPISGAISTTFTTDTAGTFYFTVTASNGCTSSNQLSITTSSCLPGGCPPLTGTAADTCRTISLHGITGSYTSGYFWTALGTPPRGGGIIPGVNVTAIYDVPGIYLFYFENTADPCTDIPVYDTVGVVPEFRYQLQCAVGGIDSVFLSDYTAYLPFYTVSTSSIMWSITGASISIPNGPNPRIALAAPGTYTIEETVTGTGPDGTYSCDTVMTITLPSPPYASFTDTLSPICEGIPINFTATSTAGIVTYSWNFGDTSYSILQNPQKTYNYNPAIPLIPQPDTVTLTITDSLGCVGDTSEIVQIYPNLLAGNLGPTIQTVCSSAPPITLAYLPFPLTSTPASYLWSTGATTTTISVSQSGEYWVTVVDANQCQGTFPTPAAVQVKILPAPVATPITGLQNYCFGAAVNLSAYDGLGVSYDWLRNGLPDGSTYSISDAGLPPAEYQYQVVVTLLDTPSGISCPNSSAIDTVYMHGLPSLPVITGPTVVDCASYHLELTGLEPESGTYNWSNGTIGAVDDIYSGGPYRVWFTDMNGCVSEQDISVPEAPNIYFPYFPTGCYMLCNQQLPITLFGPPDIFLTYWAWLRNGDTTSSGTLLMSPDTVYTAGSYQMTIGNLICSQTTGLMNVDTMECTICGNKTLSAVITCDSSNPASYGIVVTVNSPVAGTTYTLGTDIGPIDPFSGTLTSAGVVHLTLTFTTLYIYPVPDSVSIELSLTMPDGVKCFQTIRMPLPGCAWEAERFSGDTTGNNGDNSAAFIANAMLVFPNPTSGEVTISYNYGKSYSEKNISVYDAMGRKIATTTPQEVQGNWILNTNDWTAGIYIIRMEADGKALQTQRMVVVSKY